MEKLNPRDENSKFALNYNKSIEEPGDLFRCGDEKTPITALRCDELSPSRQYEHGPPRADFLIDDNGYIIARDSSGNFCSQYTIK